MTIIIAILIAIPSTIGVLLVIAFFVKREYTVEREILIRQPKQFVFDYIKYLKNQDHYNVWSLRDPQSGRHYRGTDGTVGFVSGWDSSNERAGKGEQEIKRIIEGEMIALEIRIERPFRGIVNAFMTTKETGDQTIVTWHFFGRMTYPFNIIRLTIKIEKVIAHDLDVSLTNLKNILETRVRQETEAVPWL